MIERKVKPINRYYVYGIRQTPIPYHSESDAIRLAENHQDATKVTTAKSGIEVVIWERKNPPKIFGIRRLTAWLRGLIRDQ